MLDAKEPIFSDTYEDPVDFRPSDGAMYVYGRSIEPRASHIDGWISSWPEGLKIEFREKDDPYAVEAIASRSVRVLSLRSREQMEALWGVLPEVVYIDITGLSHHVWAPVVRSLLVRSDVEIRVVYVEPDEYVRGRSPTPGQPYDLSSRIRGLSPLPGFASLSIGSANELFVPLLGFEGARLAYMLEQVQPKQDFIYPVIGLPGFRAHYVYETYAGNARALAASGAADRVRYLPADCPFGVVRLLERLAAGHKAATIRLAMIGTKPHALGAVLYKILKDPNAELIYDHPIRKEDRTSGWDRLHVYYIDALKTA